MIMSFIIMYQPCNSPLLLFLNVYYYYFIKNVMCQFSIILSKYRKMKCVNLGPKNRQIKVSQI